MVENTDGVKKRAARSVSSLDVEEKKVQNGVTPKAKGVDYNRMKTKICHAPAVSYLTAEKNWTDYNGLINLTKLMLVFANLRLFIENMSVFGLQVKVFPPLFEMMKDPITWTNSWILVEIQILAMVSLHIERLIARDILSYSVGKCIQIINCLLILILPVSQILLAPSMPFPSFMSLAFSITVFLKIWSYSQANRWYKEFADTESNDKMVGNKSESQRHRRHSVPAKVYEQSREMAYPDNLTTGNLYYFLLAPTLCYEMKYPRTRSIRIHFVAMRLFESLFLGWLITACAQQWIITHLQRTFDTMEENIKSDAEIALFEILAMAVPNTICFLLFFVLLFHSWMNFLAEILMFGDREFYKDWWNAKDIITFWKNWNMPVHKWCVRHIYKPMLRDGYSKEFVGVVVFFFSAVMHELVVSVPLQRLRFYSFIGMFAQVPMVPITASIVHYAGNDAGNIAVWTQLCLGQPLGWLAYFTDWFLFR